MKRSKVGMVLFFGTLTLTIGGWVVFGALSKEPSYKDKPLRYWMLLVGSPEAESVREAQQALRAMGPRAARIIGRTLMREGSPATKGYRHFWVRLPSCFERVLPRPNSREDLLNDCFLALGLIGEPAVPTLIQQFNSPDASIRYMSIIALATVGKAAVPALVSTLRSSNIVARRSAIRTLAFIPEVPRSVLLKAVRDPRPEVGTEAELALQMQSPEQAELVAEMLQLLGSPIFHANPSGATNAVVIPGLLMRLTDPDPRVRATAERGWAIVVKWDGNSEMILSEAVMEYYLNSNNRLVRQEAAFFYWRQKHSDFMVDLLVKELRTAPDLETGTRLLNHFEDMGKAVKPYVAAISNIVSRSPQLQTLSNQVFKVNQAAGDQ